LAPVRGKLETILIVPLRAETFPAAAGLGDAAGEAAGEAAGDAAGEAAGDAAGLAAAAAAGDAPAAGEAAGEAAAGAVVGGAAAGAVVGEAAGVLLHAAMKSVAAIDNDDKRASASGAPRILRGSSLDRRTFSRHGLTACRRRLNEQTVPARERFLRAPVCRERARSSSRSWRVPENSVAAGTGER